MVEAKNVLCVTVMSILENAEIERLLNAAPVKAGSQIHGGGLAHWPCSLPFRNIQATGCVERLLLRWPLVLACEPARSQTKLSTADHSQAQWSGKWEIQPGWSDLLGVYPSLSLMVLGLGLGNASSGEHSPSCLCLRRPCATRCGEHLLSLSQE